jgi:hypothetical protein
MGAAAFTALEAPVYQSRNAGEREVYMRKTSTKKRLQINKTTLNNLQDSELTVVVGGDPSCPGGTGPCPTNGPRVFGLE